MKKNQLYILASLGVLLIVVIVTSIIMLTSSPKSMFPVGDKDVSEVNVAFKENTKRLKETDNPGSIVYVLYKSKCPVCEEQKENILDMEKKVSKESDDIEFIYVNVDKGVPNWLQAMTTYSYEDASTPLMVQIRSDLYDGSTLQDTEPKYHAIVSGRLDSKEVMDLAPEHILSGATVSKDQIITLTNLNQLN